MNGLEHKVRTWILVTYIEVEAGFF
jgi:hypothetical protein